MVLASIARQGEEIKSQKEWKRKDKIVMICPLYRKPKESMVKIVEVKSKNLCRKVSTKLHRFKLRRMLSDNSGIKLNISNRWEQNFQKFDI